MVTIYGLSNCDTTRAAIKWLKAHNEAFTLHDYKTDGITPEKLAAWLGKLPQEKLLNKKSTTWRGLDATAQATAATQAGAIQLMQAHTSLIKRPLIEWADGSQTVGYDERLFEEKAKGGSGG